jgi:HlyD family secretion protein
MTAITVTIAGWLLAATVPNARVDDEPPKVAELVNQVEGQTFIIAIRAEGSKVKKGDIVFELESAALRDKLTNQEIALIQAKAVVDTSKKALEVAEITAQESEAGTVEEIKSTENDIRVAELDIKFAKEKIEIAKATQKTQGDRADFDKYVSYLAVAEAALNTAHAKLKTLKGITKQKRKVESDLNVAKAQTEVKSAEAILVLEKAKSDKLRKMIEACVVKAPIDGRVMYANPKVPREDGYRIEEGASVRLRQVIVRILPD